MAQPTTRDERKTEPYEGSHRLRLDWTVNVGVVFHLVGLVCALIGIMITIAAWKAATDERLLKIEERQTTMEEMNHQTQQLLYQQNERLARIEGKLDTEIESKKYPR